VQGARGQVRYRLSDAQSVEALLVDLREELLALQNADPELVDTSLLVHPQVFARFLGLQRLLGGGPTRC